MTLPRSIAMRRVAMCVLSIILMAFPLAVGDNMVSIAFVVLQYSLIALGLNIIVGWTGLLDLGAAGFVAVGAYATAIYMTRFGLPPLVVFPICLVAGFTAGILLGIPTLRHRLDYFAVLTLGFAELVALAIRNWTPVTRGSFGYSGIPATTVPFHDAPLRTVPPIGFYYFALAIAVPIYFFCIWLRHTPLGREFQIVKHSETVGRVYGVNILAVKLIAFSLSAGIISAGGFLWAIYQRSIVWTEFNVLLSCLLLSLLIVGGLGNPNGAIVGAAIVGSSLELIRRFLTSFGFPQEIRYLMFATALVVFIRVRPAGLLPDRPSWVPRLRRLDGRGVMEGDRVSCLGVEAGNVLEIEEVAKAFDSVKALQGFSLSIPHEACIALIGPNGSGKTTLLNVICGLARPDAGAIRYRNQRADKMPPFRLARAGLGRSFQDLSVCDDLTAEDNVFLTARGVSPRLIASALARFGIEDGSVPCGDLPYGKKKALDLARLFLQPSRLRVVLLDEPTAGLTQREGQEVVRSLAALREWHRFAMLVISHDAMFLEALKPDRVVVIQQGKVFKDGELSTIRQDEDVRRLFWGN
ncbi:MAG TPA: ATP-binding cassette domain-containing protein [Thermoanaerobaculia bacterium]|nr:ATP-binding cassette domain-containing protein [Thermoanaerobaculia bacterium]